MMLPKLKAVCVSFVVVLLLASVGCASAKWSNDNARAAMLKEIEPDRKAILGMAGSFKVTFAFQESIALRDGYKLHKPYSVKGRELVVVAEDRGDVIVLQHLLLVGSGEKTHVIHHWRQDWRYLDGSGYAYTGDGAWRPLGHGVGLPGPGSWMQSIYNVDDSPRYSSFGDWRHGDGVSKWIGSETKRPRPLRESHLADQYDYLDAVNTHVVTDKGWLHYQLNKKIDKDHKTQPVLALEHGVNSYVRVPDKGFEKAHDYWNNTAPYWAQVRKVWDEVFAQGKPITLQSKWKGDSMYSHLFGMSYDYWGVKDASKAKPRIEKVVNAFLKPGK